MRLRELQQWFQRQLAGPNERPVTGAASDAEAAGVVKTTGRLSPAQRLAIYSDMYFLRVFDVLTDDFPTTRHLLGEAEWNEVVRGYLTGHPSRSWTLDRLGADLPAYLAARDDLARHALLADVARIERAMDEVTTAPEDRVLSPEEFAAVEPAMWAECGLAPQSAFRLMAFDYPVTPILNAVRHDEPLPPLDPEPAWVVVYRKEFRAWRRSLTRPMYETLAALERGALIPEALGAAAETWEGSDEELQQAVFAWFQEWVAEGLFAGVTMVAEEPHPPGSAI